MDRAIINRLLLFFGVAALVGAVDLGTKSWASGELARLDHPIPMHVGQQDDGKSVGDFLKGSDFPDAVADDIIMLDTPFQPDGGLFPVERVTRDMGYYLFLEPERDSPPVFIPNPTMAPRKEKGSAFNLATWMSESKAKGLTVAQVVVESVTFISEEEAAELVSAGLLHPITRASGAVGLGDTVKAGDILMLTHRQIELIPGFLRFVYAENPGAAWGFLGEAPLLVRKIVLQAFSFLAMLLLCYVVMRDKTPDWKLNSVSLAMIMGGALGNFVDRLGRDVVVDFIDMYVGDAHWPTYNVADIGISVGVGLLMIQMLRKRSPF